MNIDFKPDPEDLAAVVLAAIRAAGLPARLLLPTGGAAHHYQLMCGDRRPRVVPVAIGLATSLEEAVAMLPEPYAAAVRGRVGRDPRCRCSAEAIAGWGTPDTHLSACPLYIAYPADFSAPAADALRNVQCRHDDALRALDALRDQVRDFLTEWDKPNVGNPHFEIDVLRRATGESGPIVPGADQPINQFRERAERYAKKART